MTSKKFIISNLILIALMLIILIFNNVTNFFQFDLTTFLTFVVVVIQQLFLCYYCYTNKQKKYSILFLFGIIILSIFYIKRFF